MTSANQCPVPYKDILDFEKEEMLLCLHVVQKKNKKKITAFKNLPVDSRGKKHLYATQMLPNSKTVTRSDTSASNVNNKFAWVLETCENTFSNLDDEF